MPDKICSLRTIKRMKVRELVYRASHRQLGLPEIQRGTVWNERRAQELVDSLYKGWPIGSMVFWQAPTSISVIDRSGKTSSGPSDWVLDGQQRTTALCILFGSEPYWLKTDVAKKVQFNPRTQEFRTVPVSRKGVPTVKDGDRPKGRPTEWVDVSDILGSTTDDIIDVVIDNLGLPSEKGIEASSRHRTPNTKHPCLGHRLLTT